LLIHFWNPYLFAEVDVTRADVDDCPEDASAEDEPPARWGLLPAKCPWPFPFPFPLPFAASLLEPGDSPAPFSSSEWSRSRLLELDQSSFFFPLVSGLAGGICSLNNGAIDTPLVLHHLFFYITFAFCSLSSHLMSYIAHDVYICIVTKESYWCQRHAHFCTLNSIDPVLEYMTRRMIFLVFFPLSFFLSLFISLFIYFFYISLNFFILISF